ARAAAADRGSPNPPPRSAESDLPPVRSECAGRLGDRSFACELAWPASWRRRRSTTRSSALPRVVQTSVPVRWLPCLRVPSSLVPRDRDKTFPPPRDAAVAAPVTPQYRCPQKQFAGIPGDNRSLQLTCCLLLPGLGWFARPKFTRAWEATLSWNH